MSSITSIATKDLIHRIIKSGADPIKAEGLMVKVLHIDGSAVTLGFDVVDNLGKWLAEIRSTAALREGESLRIMGLDAVFNITVG